MNTLRGIKVIELSGLAPVPMCGLILSDFGAKVIRIDNFKNNLTDEILNRGKQSICLDLKQNKQIEVFKRLLQTSDVLLDPYRPGVLERLHLAPIDLQKDNPKLIIARLTGYGQPNTNDSKQVSKQKLKAGHDINYIALSGILSKIGSNNTTCPQAPLNIIGDFAAGSLSCAFAIVLALLRRQQTGLGEIIDCSMTHGSAYLSSFVWRSRDQLSFIWPQVNKRGSNMLDGGAPFYRCYRTKDDKFIAVGAIEPPFYSCLLQLLEIPESEAIQLDYNNWDKLSNQFANIFSTKSQNEWIDKADNCGDCCLTPVLELDEAAQYWQQSFMNNDGYVEPKPQPIFVSKDKIEQTNCKRPVIGQDTERILLELGYNQEQIIELMKLYIAKI